MAKTRSITRDARSRNVFEQPPVMDVILKHLGYDTTIPPTETLGDDFVNLRCVFKSPCVTDVIRHHEDHNKKKYEEFQKFISDIKAILKKTELVNDLDDRRVFVCELFDYIVTNKHMLHLSNFEHFRGVVLSKLDECRDLCPVFKRDFYQKYFDELKF